MSKRLLEARDGLGDKLIAMRLGKEAHVRNTLSLEREVYTLLKAIKTSL